MGKTRLVEEDDEEEDLLGLKDDVIVKMVLGNDVVVAAG